MGRAPCCDKASVKRGPWSPQEDVVLKTYIEKNGTGGNWITLPQRAGLKRCGKSCRLRWLNYLRPEIKHGGFSVEEDAIIYALYRALGSRWSVIASRLPGRTDNDVKNYWNTKLKKRYSAQRQKQVAEETAASVEYAARAASASSPNASAVSAPSAATSSLPPPLSTTSSCSYPYLTHVDYSNFGQSMPSTSPLPICRSPAFLSTSLEGAYVVTPTSKDDVSSSAPSGTPSSLTADYGGGSGVLAFSSTMIDDYGILPTPLDLKDASTTSSTAAATASSSSSLILDSRSGGGGEYQPWQEADESFFAEAEAAFESYYFSSSSSSSANLPGWSGAGGSYNWGSGGAGDSGLLWGVVLDSAYS